MPFAVALITHQSSVGHQNYRVKKSPYLGDEKSPLWSNLDPPLCFKFMVLNDILRDRSFTCNQFAQALYFFKSQYFIFSAHQCVSGYPKRVLGYFISKHYNLFASLAFQGYVTSVCMF